MINAWLKERANLLLKYAEHLSKKTDVIEFKVAPPEVGWMPIHIIVNGEEQYVVEVSSVYEPFYDIRTWLEDIVKNIFKFTPSAVNINCEGYHCLLYLEPLFFSDDQLLLGNPELNGVFYLYDSYDEKIVAEAFCNVKELVRQFYMVLVDFAKANIDNADFVNDWIWDAYHEECVKYEDCNDPHIKEMFYNVVKSDIVEKFLADDKSTTRYKKIK